MGECYSICSGLYASASHFLFNGTFGKAVPVDMFLKNLSVFIKI